MKAAAKNNSGNAAKERQSAIRKRLLGRRVKNVVETEDGLEIQFGNKATLTIKHRAIPNPLEGGYMEWTSFAMNGKEILRK